MSPKMKQFLGKSLVSMMSTGAILLLLEFCFRHFIPFVQVGPVFTTYTEEYGLGNKRNLNCVRITPEYRNVVKTNQFGLRGEEVTQNKPSHTKRILCLGDSFTFGKGVEDGQTYSRILLEKLNSRLGLYSYEVLNSGVVSFGTANEYLYLSKQGLRFDPDLIVLQFYSNDFQDNVLCGLYYLDEKGLLREGKEPYKKLKIMVGLYNKIPPPARELLDYSYFFNFIRLRLNIAILFRGAKKAGNKRPTETRSTAIDTNVEAYQLTNTLLEEIIRLCQKNRVPIVLMVFDLSGTEANQILSVAAKCKVSVLDLGNLKKDHPEFYYPIDGHWNAGGHIYVANRLYDFLQKADAP